MGGQKPSLRGQHLQRASGLRARQGYGQRELPHGVQRAAERQNRNRDAVVVDIRHNGGGWLHDDLCTLLSGKQYQTFVPHGQEVGKDPWNKWTKPSCVLMCEDDYSNGHGFPAVYKTLGIGKLVGTPVAGTMTAVWWERLIDSSVVFGIPQVGCRFMDGTFAENKELLPDIEVYNTPEDYLSGNDRQLKRAVEEMMKH